MQSLMLVLINCRSCQIVCPNWALPMPVSTVWTSLPSAGVGRVVWMGRVEGGGWGGGGRVLNRDDWPKDAQPKKKKRTD